MFGKPLQVGDVIAVSAHRMGRRGGQQLRLRFSVNEEVVAHHPPLEVSGDGGDGTGAFPYNP